jgi:hypothetical protein
MIQPPKRNLPPDAEMWGRWVDKSIVDSNSGMEITSQSLQNTLSAINGTLQQISGQIVTIVAQQEWLSTATRYSSDITSGSGWDYSINPPAVTDVTFAFDSLYDCELTFSTTKDSEAYIVNMSADLLNQISVNTAWGALDVRIGLEVTYEGVSGVYPGIRWATATPTQTGGDDFWMEIPAFKSFQIVFPVAGEYILRTQRNVITSHGGATVGFIGTTVVTAPFCITRTSLIG